MFTWEKLFPKKKCFANSKIQADSFAKVTAENKFAIVLPIHPLCFHLITAENEHHSCITRISGIMEYFPPCQLSNTGSFTPIEGEFVLTTIDKTTFLTHDKKPTPHVQGLLTVTTHRLVWMDSTRTSGVAAWLAHLPPQRPFEDKSSPFHSRVLLRYGAGIRIELDGSSSGKNRDRLLTQMTEALRRKEWENVARLKAAEAARKAQEEEYVPRRIGVSGVQDRVQQHSNEQRKTIETGFESLEQLRQQAADLVKIASAFRSATMKADEEDNELVNMMAEMGIESPVTKSSTGGNVKVYREQLSRQLAQFLRTPILNVGGIMTMTDAYCLVMRNRATTELVSPQDFRAACEFFRVLHLPMHIMRLESGVDALEVDASMDHSGSAGLRKLADERTSVTAIDVMRIRHVPIQRALIMLETAETHGLLARDETTQGLRFFPNSFSSFASRAQTSFGVTS